MTRHVRRARYDGKKVTVEIETFNPDDPEPVDSLVITSAQAPKPAFTKALVALGPHVLDLLELPKKYGIGLTIRGVTYTWKINPNGGMLMGATICALKSLSGANAPLILNTPHLPAEAYSGNDEDPNPVLPPEMVELLEEIASCALAYVDGARAQGSLFGGRAVPANKKIA